MGKFKFLKPGIKAGFVLGSTMAGAIVGSDAAPQGLKTQGAKEGAAIGLISGLALVSTPTIGKFAAKGASATTKKAFAKGARRAQAYGKLMFRKVRGRIIPIRVK